MLSGNTTTLDPEVQRLQALQPYQAMENTRQEIFQEIVRLTAKIFVTPIAILSLVGEKTVTYPGMVGLPDLAGPVPHYDTICAGAVQRADTTVFVNLRAYPCPWSSVQAQAKSDAPFYAGHPLKTAEAQPIGMLCVMDREPRNFSAQEKLILQQLTAIAMRLLDLHRAQSENPAQALSIWQAINARISLSIQRIETLTALAQWEISTATITSRVYLNSMHEERLLIIQDIDYEVTTAFARLSSRRQA